MASIRLKSAAAFIQQFSILILNSRPKSWHTKRTLLNLGLYKLSYCEHTHVRCLKTGVSTWQFKGVNKSKTKKYNPSQKEKEPTVKIWANMTAGELAETTGCDIDDICEAISPAVDDQVNLKPSISLGDVKAIYNICKKLGYRIEIVANPKFEVETKEDKDVAKRPPPRLKDLVKKAPVVAIMGHVDHGKTTLLDSLRHTSVVQNEHGGITQHIGAFTVNVNKNEKVTFLDTPGHAAFSAMRARGAYVTDIVVLVVAADDGVMEQTVESIRYAREAEVPIIVAVNKMDKPHLDLERVKSGLISAGLEIEGIGGDVQMVYISALTGLNMNHLIDAILAQAEIMEIKGDPSGLVEGVILESTSDTARGKLATVLIQRGTLKKGAYLVSGTAWAKVRTMFDEWGKTMQLAPPGTPVQVLGWKELPSAGEEILELLSEKEAKEVVARRQKLDEEAKQLEDLPMIQMKRDEHLFTYNQALEERRLSGRRRYKRKNIQRTKEIVVDDHPKFSVVIKGDVDGSVEAILDVINTYESDNFCSLDVVHYGVGPVSENDVEMAEMFKGIVYTFNVKPLAGVRETAKKLNVPIKAFNVIYKLVDDLKDELSQRLPLVDQEEILGEADVRQQFLVTEGKKKDVPIAGCRCRKGTLKKDSMFRLVRKGETIHEGPLATIRHLKNEVNSVKKDTECGLRLEDTSVTYEPGDVMICYVIHKVPQRTNWKPPGF